MRSFESESADGAWLLAVQAIRNQSHLQPGRGGNTSELLHAVIEVRDSRQRWVVSRCPGLSVAFAIVEVIGILNGRRDSAFLNFFNPILPRYAGTGPEYYGVYGFRLRASLGFDQLERASMALKAKPYGRQVVLQIWDAAQDLPLDDGEPIDADIPCNICSMLKVRDNRLEWSQIMRSNDLFKGLPYNFIQFTTLQEVLAGWIGIEPGAYTHYADSLHLYEVDAENAFSSTSVSAASVPDSLALPKHQADPIWIEMNRRVDLLVQDGVGATEYKNLAQIEDAPVAFSSLMAIVVADAARRRGFVDEMNEAVAVCANPLMKQLWFRWANRWSSGT